MASSKLGSKGSIVINTYIGGDETADSDENFEMLKTFLEDESYDVVGRKVKLALSRDLSNYREIITKVRESKHTISIVTQATKKLFERDDEYYLTWLRALHKALEADNVLTHIIFCVDTEAGEVEWYLRQFHPCIEYKTGTSSHAWRKELHKILRAGTKSLTCGHVNVGEALAWSHYTGYVCFLEEKSNKEARGVWAHPDGEPVIEELVMLIADSCCCQAKELPDPKIKFVCSSRRYEFERAGKKRALNANLYKIEGEKKLVPIAYTPSIATLFKMKEENDLCIPETYTKWLEEQRDRYYEVLKVRIGRSEYLSKNIKLIHYDDSIRDRDGHTPGLADKILSHIHETKEEPMDVGQSVGAQKRKKITVHISYAEKDSSLAKEANKILQDKVHLKDGKTFTFTVTTASANQEKSDIQIIDDADKFVIILTENYKNVLKLYRGLEKVLRKDNRRACTVLYTENVQKTSELSEILEGGFVSKVKYGSNNWEGKLKDEITNQASKPMSQVVFKNIAESLAFGFYYGYLQIFLPEFCQLNLHVGEKEVMKKLLVLMPKSGDVPRSLADVCTHVTKCMESDIQPTGWRQRLTKDVACQERQFFPAVYKVPIDDQDYFVAAECLTPLRAIQDMKLDKFADIDDKDVVDEQRRLRKITLEIKKRNMLPKELEDKVILIEIEDVDEERNPIGDKEKKSEIYFKSIVGALTGQLSGGSVVKYMS